MHANESGILTNSSAALSDFVPPTPPAGSDPHRYDYEVQTPLKIF